MGSKYKAAVCKGVAQGQEISATEEKVDIISFIESRKNSQGREISMEVSLKTVIQCRFGRKYLWVCDSQSIQQKEDMKVDF